MRVLDAASLTGRGLFCGYQLTIELAGEPHLRLQSKPNDGEQVEPALAESENVRAREARNFDGELARE